MNMNIIPFEYESNEIRVVQDESGDPWWFASDVCKALGIVNTSDAISGLDDDERSTIGLTDGGPERIIINEPGLYHLISKSKKPEAKKFQRWIYHKVLPSIRKTGKYEIEGLSELDLIIRSAQALKNVELKTVEHDQRLISLEAKSHQNSGFTGYWTITAWCRLNNLRIGLEEATKRGREAARVSTEWGIEICKVPDERFGHVNSYREDVLEEVFVPVDTCV